MLRIILKLGVFLWASLSFLFALTLLMSVWTLQSAPMIAFKGSGDLPGMFDLYLLDTRHGLQFSIASAATSKVLEWSPDGAHILLDVNFDYGATSPDSATFFYLVDTHGHGEIIPLADETVREDITWSPDGQYLLYREINNTGGSNLSGSRTKYVIIAPSGEVVSSFELEGILHNNPALWSPQGDRLLMVQQRDTADIIIVDAASGEMVDFLSLTQTNEERPAWSPDGQKIAYVSRDIVENDVTDLYSGDLVTGEVTHLTTLDGGTLGTISWSPGGDHIVFNYHIRDASNGAITTFVGLYDFETGITEIIQRPSSFIYRSPWSEDGRYVAFISVVDSSRGRTAALFQLDAYSGHIQQLTSGPDGIQNPAWRPTSDGP